MIKNTVGNPHRTVRFPQSTREFYGFDPIRHAQLSQVKAVGAVAAYIDISDDYITEPDKAR
jgi:hypothetical protein